MVDRDAVLVGYQAAEQKSLVLSVKTREDIKVRSAEECEDRPTR